MSCSDRPNWSNDWLPYCIFSFCRSGKSGQRHETFSPSVALRLPCNRNMLITLLLWNLPILLI